MLFVRVEDIRQMNEVHFTMQNISFHCTVAFDNKPVMMMMMMIGL